MVRDVVLSPPEVLGPYRVVRELGSGGMGTVYLAEAPDGRAVAVKLLRPELAADRDFLARFRREVEAARRVAGSCTARVLDADVSGPAPYFVTEYVDGPSLGAAVARDGPLPAWGLEGFAVGVAAALTAIHAAGLVHRDLKPANVLLSPYGPRVIDFGIARALDEAGLTRTGVLLGTPGWMAPEQLVGTGAGPAADVYLWAAWWATQPPAASPRRTWRRCPTACAGRSRPRRPATRPGARPPAPCSWTCSAISPPPTRATR